MTEGENLGISDEELAALFAVERVWTAPPGSTVIIRDVEALLALLHMGLTDINARITDRGRKVLELARAQGRLADF